MRIIITLAFLVLILIWGVNITLSVTQQVGPNTSIVSNLSIPKILTYIAKLTNTTTIGNKTVTKIYNYTVSYQLLKVNDYVAVVNISGNFTNGILKLGNTIYLREGQYNVSVQYQPLSLYYPFILSELLYNTSYGILTPNESLVLTYKGKGFYTLNGVNNTVYNFTVYVNGNEITATIMPNGIVTYLQNGSLSMVLKSYQLLNINITSTDTLTNISNFIGKSYLYAIFNYSTLSNSTIPQGYLQINYPVLFNNGILVTQFTQIQFRSGQQLALPSLLDGKSVNYVLYVNEPTKIPTSFGLNVGGNNITWNGIEYTLVGKQQVSTIAGTFEAYVYKYITSNQTEQLLYFSQNGVLLKQELVTLLNSSAIVPLFVMNFVGNTFLNPFQTYPNVFNYTNTTLPYTVIKPNLSLTISIILTLVIVAVLVILHKRE